MGAQTAGQGFRQRYRPLLGLGVVGPGHHGVDPARERLDEGFREVSTDRGHGPVRALRRRGAGQDRRAPGQIASQSRPPAQHLAGLEPRPGAQFLQEGPWQLVLDLSAALHERELGERRRGDQVEERVGRVLIRWLAVREEQHHPQQGVAAVDWHLVRHDLGDRGGPAGKTVVHVGDQPGERAFRAHAAGLDQLMSELGDHHRNGPPGVPRRELGDLTHAAAAEHRVGHASVDTAQTAREPRGPLRLAGDDRLGTHALPR